MTPGPPRTDVIIVLKAAFEVEMATVPVDLRRREGVDKEQATPRAKRDEPSLRLRLALDLYKVSDT